MIHTYKIKEYVGDYISDSVAEFVKKPGEKTSYLRAIKAVKEFDSNLYDKLEFNDDNPWEDETKIIEHRNHHFLVIVHLALEYLFEISYEKDNPT